MMRRSSRSGFTLVEVLVGMVLMSMIILAVHMLSSQIAKAARAGQAAQQVLDRRSNLHRWLKGSFLSSDTGPSPFDGGRDRLSFDAWLQQPGGWFARRSIELSAKDEAFIATVGGYRVPLADSIGGVEFGYLLDEGGDARWVGVWRSRLRAPRAVRIVIVPTTGAADMAPDTLLFLLEERG
jgi:prepilin-type N-terminal cleavage/methylation domain-containing protein